MLYQAYQMQADWWGALPTAAPAGAAYLNHDACSVAHRPSAAAVRKLAAALEVFSRLRLTHTPAGLTASTAVQVGERACRCTK